MRFKDLASGAVFTFTGNAFPLEPGPWQKVSKRCYIKNTTPFGSDAQADMHVQWFGLRCEVGSINIEVMPLANDVFAA